MDARSNPMEAQGSAATFRAQANALLRKNLVFQKRRWKTNLLLIIFPVLMCVFLFLMQVLINLENEKPKNKCGCACVPVNGSSSCSQVCGIEYSTGEQALTCAVTSPPEVPAMLQLPEQNFLAVNFRGQFPGYPEPSCRDSNSCPSLFLYTSQNQSLANALVNNIWNNNVSADTQDPLSTLVLGTDAEIPMSYYVEPALPNDFTILSRNCTNFSSPQPGIPCLSTLMLWRNESSKIEEEIYRGFRKGNEENNINAISLAYDFSRTSSRNLDVLIYYNSSYRGDVNRGDSLVLRVAKNMNLAAVGFLKTFLGASVEIPLSFIAEMPKQATKRIINFSVLLGPIFYMWIIQLLLPVMLVSLVYEKEQKLRMMMKIHGLGDGPYWFVTYIYYLVFSMLYMVLFLVFGTIIGLEFFKKNAYSIQLVLYFVYMNLQIVLAFLGTAFFSRAMTATVCGYLYVFGFGLLGGFLFENYVEDKTISRGAIFAMELLPGFALHRGLYELTQYAFLGSNRGTEGMRWSNLGDEDNGLRTVLLIMAVEWLVFLFLALYLDQVLTSGSGVRKSPLFFLRKLGLKSPVRSRARSLRASEPEPGRADVESERALVESLREKNDASYAIVCDGLQKVYPGRDGNPPNHAVRGLSLAIRRGECFGMLGPNGAGKTTSINMMIGFLAPSSGTALVGGLDIRTDMDKIYTIMGVCPQENLLWETLTGREHLLFYGRLKNLKGAELEEAVESSLKNVNLFNDGAGNKRAGAYSGGMKRRLSVAISLMGNTKAVYMDEPSTGLDPASRRTLWNAIKRAKESRAVILTTHSMEEAEALCDRIGIFVNGQLQCIGSCKQLRSRYGGTYVFTVTGDPGREEEIARLVHDWSSSAKRVYNIAGTQKFEMRKEDVKLAKVFKDMEKKKVSLGITAWGMTDTTLEDVFIKVAS